MTTFYKPRAHPYFRNISFKEMEKLYGGMRDMYTDPIKHAHTIIAHIDNKRKELGIDKAGGRFLMDMGSRQALEA